MLKKTICAIAILSGSIFASFAHAEMTQFEIKSASYSDNCNLTVPGKKDPAFPDSEMQDYGPVGNAGCFATMDRSLFEQKFEFCALTGIETVNPGSRVEINLGGSCRMLIQENRIYWSVSRGSGWKEGVSGSNSCTYTCLVK